MKTENFHSSITMKNCLSALSLVFAGMVTVASLCAAEKPLEDDYMIIDLDTGAVTYEGIFTCQAASNARYNTAEYKTRKMVLRKVAAGGLYLTGHPNAPARGQRVWKTDRDYYLSIFQVTQAQYAKLMGKNPSRFNAAKYPKFTKDNIVNIPDHRPVERVSWDDLRGADSSPSTVLRGNEHGTFIERLIARTNLAGLDLPTEVMWEIAARAGGRAMYFWGEDTTENAELYVTCKENSVNNKGEHQTWPVGVRRPNAWGFYDMAGNVVDFCRDGIGNERNTYDPARYARDPWTPAPMARYAGGSEQEDSALGKGGHSYGWGKDNFSFAVSRVMYLPRTQVTDYRGFRIAYIAPSKTGDNVANAKNSVSNDLLPVIPQPKSWRRDAGKYFKLPSVLRVGGSSFAARALVSDWRRERGESAAAAHSVLLLRSGVVFARTKDPAVKGEGYRITITPNRITVEAETPTGEYWATRTLLQLFRASDNVPCGVIEDAPRYAYRGFMLDVARKPYSLDFLRLLARNLAYYKMNVLHVHLNDDGVSIFIGRKGYRRFRMECELCPELTAKDGHYTKAEFREFVKEAARIGVTVIPEIDTPAHSGCFSQVMPEFASKEYDMTHLALDKPEVIEFMDKLFAEYLGGPDPVFAGPYFHVGTDEYDKRAAEPFRGYTDKMFKLTKKYGKIPCAWGALSHAAGETPVMSDGVIMDIWYNPYYNPLDAIEDGYKIVSVPDRWLYIVPAAGYYRDYLDCKWIFENWEPCRVHTVTLPHDHPQLLGGKFALWNDISGNGISEDDTFDRVFPAVQTLSQKMWTGTVPNQPYAEFSKLAQKTGEAPGVNQADRLTGPGQTLAPGDVAVGWTQDGGYTVSFEMRPSFPDDNDILFDDGFSKVGLFDGRVGFVRDSISFAWNFKPHPERWTSLEFIGDAKGVELVVDGVSYGVSAGKKAKRSRGKHWYDAPRTLHFPLKLTESGRQVVRGLKVKTGKPSRAAP